MKKKTTKKNFWPLAKKVVLISISSGTILVLVCLAIIAVIIKSSINSVCTNAQTKYATNCSQSLIKLLSNPNETFHDKNDAIWTLGRLRSQEALPVLLSLYTGNIPDREPYDTVISQYEIRKALLQIDKNTNVSPRAEKTLQEKLADCLPKSDMGSKKICDDLVNSITTYKDCADAGFPIQETYPPRCSTPNGRYFIGPR